jgi:phosphatidylglycerophosphate synthase
VISARDIPVKSGRTTPEIDVVVVVLVVLVVVLVVDVVVVVVVVVLVVVDVVVAVVRLQAPKKTVHIKTRMTKNRFFTMFSFLCG